VDTVNTATRSRMMSRIRGKDTQPELTLRKLLHASGFRFRVHGGDLPGRPDVVLPRRRAAVFVHGCFWHRHEGCKFATTPRSNSEFWNAKFLRTKSRDRDAIESLVRLGWRVAVIWECALDADALGSSQTLGCWLTTPERTLEIPVGPTFQETTWDR
jgi:DNA mismatch endonuclease (patch repair protein)